MLKEIQNKYKDKIKDSSLINYVLGEFRKKDSNLQDILDKFKLRIAKENDFIEGMLTIFDKETMVPQFNSILKFSQYVLLLLTLFHENAKAKIDDEIMKTSPPYIIPILTKLGIPDFSEKDFLQFLKNIKPLKLI